MNKNKLNGMKSYSKVAILKSAAPFLYSSFKEINSRASKSLVADVNYKHLTTYYFSENL